VVHGVVRRDHHGHKVRFHAPKIPYAW
jgi:hypothetical protein